MDDPVVSPSVFGDCGTGAVSRFGDFVSLCALGPLTLLWRCSFADSRVESMLCLGRPRKLNSLLLFGSDEDTNGDTAFCRGVLLVGVGIGFVGLSAVCWRECCVEVLLRAWEASVGFSARCLDEKKEVFEAVIGVVGVLALIRAGGVCRPAFLGGSLLSCAIFAAVGVLNGKRFNGGRRSGCSCFFCGVAFGFCSTSVFDPLVYVERGIGPIDFTLMCLSLPEDVADHSFVELLPRLFKLLVSYGICVLRTENTEASSAASFGDSYCFGMAGTGGGSSSSFADPALLVFGVGNLDIDGI